MLEAHGIVVFRIQCPYFCGVLHAGLNGQDPRDTVRAGERLGHIDDQVRELDEFNQNLRHVVDKRNQFTLRDNPVVHLDRADPDEHQRRQVDDRIGERVHECRDLAHKQLQACQFPVFRMEARNLFLFLIEGADHAGAGQVFARNAQRPIQFSLYLFI